MLAKPLNIASFLEIMGKINVDSIRNLCDEIRGRSDNFRSNSRHSKLIVRTGGKKALHEYKTPKRLPFKYLKNSYRSAPDSSSNVMPYYILKVTRKIPLTWEEIVGVEESVSEELLVSIITYCHINYWNSDTRRSPKSAENWNSYYGLLCQIVLTFCGVNDRNLRRKKALLLEKTISD